MSLRASIILLVLAATLPPLMAIGWLLVQQRDVEAARAESQLLGHGQGIAENLEDRIGGTGQLLFGLARVPMLESGDKAACSEFLADVLREHPQYTGVLTILPNGEVFCDSLRTGRELNVTDRDYFQRAMRSDRTVVEPVFGRLTGIAVLQIAYAARGTDGQVKYVLLASLNLDQFTRSVVPALPYPGMLVHIWDRQGTVIARQPESGSIPVGAPYADAISATLVLATGDGESRTMTIDDPPAILSVATLPRTRDTGLRLILEAPRAVVISRADREIAKSSLFLLGPGLLALIGAALLAEFAIRRQAMRVIGAVARLDAGDFSSRLGSPYPRGEFGTLMAALDRTAASLEAQRDEIMHTTSALSESEGLLRIAGSTAHLGGWSIKLPEFRVTWSDEVSAIHGTEPGFSPALDEGIEWYAPEFREIIQSSVQACARDGTPYDLELQIVLATGRRVWVRTIGVAERDAAGTITRLHGAFQDIDDRKLAEEQLRHSEQHLRTVIDTSPESITLVSADGIVRQTNAAGLAMNEADHLEEVIGKPLDGFIAPDDRVRVLAFHSTVCGGQAGTLTYGLVGLRGGKRTVETASAPLSLLDGSVCNLAISRDVTDTRRLEEQLRQSQKIEAVGQLAGGIAHDFNNILTIVIGYCEILRAQETLSGPNQAMVGEIEQAGNRAAALTRQLLAFSRKQVLEPTVVNLNDIIGDLSRMLGRLIGEDVVLTSSPFPNLWPVKLDVGQTEQIIVNLAVNARDAMPNGGKLTIETANIEWDADYCRSRPERSPGRYVRLSLTDTGAGMATDVVSHIFEPFFTTKEPGKGTGLGLAVVHGIVKQSDGFVDVYSEVGVGTSFSVYYPVAVEAARGDAAARAVEAPIRGTETVLLVEDESQVRLLAKLTLEGQGYRVLEAANGPKALEVVAAQHEPIHLVVSDVVMPEMSGRTLVEQLRTRLPTLKVLFVSGYTDDAIVRHGIIDATYGFLQKPFSPQALSRKVREILDE